MKVRTTVWMAGMALLAAGLVAVSATAQMAGHQSKKETKSAQTKTAGAGQTGAGQTGTAANPWDAAQPAVEHLDLNAYMLIRTEGLQHSHVMEYGSGLADGIGPRLTGSPNMKKANEWTRDQLAEMGCVNAHLEDWGEFGMGWRQNNTWLRMASPDTAVMMGQATPWSPATNGAVTGDAVWIHYDELKDLDPYKGTLAGKIVLLGDMREVPEPDKAFSVRYTDKELEEMQEIKLTGPGSGPGGDMAARIARYMQRMKTANQVLKFLSDEKVAAVIVPSRDGKNGGGTGIIFDDNGAALGRQPYTVEGKVPFPVVVVQIESYGRVYRLLKAKVPVKIEMNVDTTFTGDHEHGFDTVAEIPGTDPTLKDQVVMVGGHLDSWIAGTGATDNGAGTIVAMEVMRILNSIGMKPRRTIRVALWSGEEEGLFGSKGYAKMHFGSAPVSTAADQMALPEFIRKVVGPLELKPEQKQVSAYFNVDNGTGKIRGIYTQGNLAVVPIFRQWMAPLSDLGVTTISTQDTGGTDHLSFDAVGIPGFQFIQDPLDYESRTHHSNMDTYERLQPGDLKQLATVEAIFVWNAANRDQMMPRKPLPHPELNDQRNAPVKNLFPDAVMGEAPAK
jgi:carboxypeptidase Q